MDDIHGVRKREIQLMAVFGRRRDKLSQSMIFLSVTWHSSPLLIQCYKVNNIYDVMPILKDITLQDTITE